MKDEENVLTLFRSVTKKWMTIVDKELIPHGITHTEARLLSMLYACDGSAQDDLSAGIEIDRSNVGRALKKLEAAGYIKREKDEIDARAFRIFLTGRGRSLEDVLRKVQNNLEAYFTRNLSPVEMKKLVSIMDKLDKGFSSEL